MSKMEKTIRELFTVNSVVQEKGFTAGLECEVEDIYRANYPTDRFTMVEDGSLRNNGHEFITAKPSGKAALLQDFIRLHAGLIHRTRDGSQAFSDRTSIHVHVNCLELTAEQVRSIIHYYALFEPMFFDLVEPARANNIHCVALQQTILPEHYRRDIVNLWRQWSKYTALNILPLKEIGTIEFRHLHGTDSPSKLSEWLTVLENLWTYGSTNIMNKKWLSDPTNIGIAHQAIFGSVLPEGRVTDTLTDVKLAFH